MKLEDYKRIYDELETVSDVDRLAAQNGLDRELLNVIYTQRTVRKTMKRHHIIKRNLPRMLREWKSGKSIFDISQKWDFSPILTGLMLFQQSGHSKKQYWSYVREPDTIADQRLKKEILEIVKADSIYSPWGNDIQVKRGQWGEEMLQNWLTENELGYRTENDLRGKFSKTPDCLLNEPVKITGRVVNWIESKASFGDKIEFNKNFKGQLSKYVEMFGNGIVVYWFGFIDDLEYPPGIEIMDRNICNLPIEKCPEDVICPEEIPNNVRV